MQNNKISNTNAWEYYFGRNSVPTSVEEMTSRAGSLIQELVRDAFSIGAISAPVGAVFDEVSVDSQLDSTHQLYSVISLRLMRGGVAISERNIRYYLYGYVYGTMKVFTLASILCLLKDSIIQLQLP